MRIGILIVFMLLVGCTSNNIGMQKKSEEKILLEQYFYYQSKEQLKKLHEKLVTEGYKVS